MDQIRKRIARALAESGKDMKEVSLAIGRNHAYLQQFLERGIPRELKERDRRQIAALLKIPENEIGGPYVPTETLREASASKIIALPVTGYVEAGKWFDIDGDGSVPDGMAVHIVGDRPLHWHRAFIVSGNSINKIAGPGDVLVCLDLMESGTEMQPDDLMIVERSRFGGQMIERTAKRLRKTATGWELWPESTDPAFQTPIVLNGADDHEEIKVTAKVLWAVRRV